MSSDTSRLGRSATVQPTRLYTGQGEHRSTNNAKPRRRTHSTSSVSSTVSSSKSDLEDQFAFSPHHTPAHERSSFFPPTQPRGPLSLALSAADSAQSSVENLLQNTRRRPISKSPPRDSRTPHSKPIAIEQPSSVSSRAAAKSVYTPIEPLSARGDLQGGYFPFHEDPEKRITRPHPFHTDSQDAQPSGDIYGQQFLSGEPSTTAARQPSLPSAAASDSQTHGPASAMSSASMSSSSRRSTPVTSYVPSGHHDVPMPLGKYYPSNYEAARSRRPTSQKTSRTSQASLRPPSSGGPSSIKSDTVVPQLNRPATPRVRSDSDAKRRLQQYQRDMVAQATQAARHLAGSKGVASLAAAHGVSLQSFQTGSSKPISPRLQPLGSPGPVTPMELEGQGDGGYITRGRSVPSPDARRDSEAVARALKAEEERKRREGRVSPTVQAGGFGF